ncbi:MAG: PDZ domain-containing protein [Flavobacteriales bacterium]|nr:PDZ domain-containing protein [Flavobacteriales bacterium]
MTSTFMHRLATLFAFVTLVSIATAQNIARIQIQKNENGVTSEETREVPLQDGQDIESLLKEMGILDEFGKLKEGQSFQISISRMDGQEGFRNMDMSIMPVPPMPPMPPMDPMSPMNPEDMFTWFGNHAFLGVMLKESEAGNPEITEVIEDTGAEEAGLEAGDIISAIDGEEMNSVEDVIDYIHSKEAGDKVKIELQRNGKKEKINATLGEKMEQLNEREIQIALPDNFDEMLEGVYSLDFKFDGDSMMIFCPSNPNCVCPNDSMKICQPFSWNQEGFELKETAFLGVMPTGLPAEKGVMINVVDGSSAKEMGLADGDAITLFNGSPVNNFEELAAMIETMAPGDAVNITAIRDGKETTFSGSIGKREMSCNEDIRIFRDFNGMDEGGNYIFDYEFDMDEQNMEQHMEMLLEQLSEQKEQLDAEAERLRSELDEYRANKSTMTISIEIESISSEELARINEKASPKLETKNDLQLESISFYPNPNDGILNLTFNLTTAGDLSVVMYDSNGSKVYMEERRNFSGVYNNTIDISEHADGTYYLQIKQGDKSYSKKIVKGE